jgi:hypothetical protein
VDRVVASVGHRVITQSDVEMEFRYEAFLSGQSIPVPPLQAASLKSACERLIDQQVLEIEFETEPQEVAEDSARARARLTEVKKRYGSAAAFEAALRSLGAAGGAAVTEQDVLGRLTRQDRILRLIDERLRPSAGVEPAEIEAYYHASFVPEYERRSKAPAPPLAEVADQIREILVQRKIDQQLTAWLASLRKERHVRILE